MITNKLALGGIGAGKTILNAVEILILSIANCTGNSVGICLAPTFDQIANVMLPELNALYDKMAKAGYPMVRRFVRSTMEFQFVCGGSLKLRSFSKVDHLRGYNAAYLSLDESEAGRNPGYVWEVASGRIRDSNAHMLEMICTTTPAGMRGVPEIFVRARKQANAMQEPERSQHLREYYAIRAQSMTNPHLPKGYLDGLKRTYSKRAWEEQVEGKILKPNTAVWPEFELARHVRPWVFDPSLSYSIACDWGHQFPHVLFIQATPDGAFVVFDEICTDNTPPAHLRAEILRRTKALGRPPTDAVGDRAVKSEMAWLISQFTSTHVHRMRTRREQSVRIGAEKLREMLDPIEGPPRFYISAKLARSDERRAIVKCLQNYRYKQRADGTIDIDQPFKDNVHDHGADCARMWAVAIGEESQSAFVMGRKYGRIHNTNRPTW